MTSSVQSTYRVVEKVKARISANNLIRERCGVSAIHSPIRWLHRSIESNAAGLEESMIRRYLHPECNEQIMLKRNSENISIILKSFYSNQDHFSGRRIFKNENCFLFGNSEHVIPAAGAFRALFTFPMLLKQNKEQNRVKTVNHARSRQYRAEAQTLFVFLSSQT
ncbi:conserved hypothetical protein [Coccidioides posadasii str. Silveira]|uniref:Uncharacterized protein n=2 Tax=Coccidioides posadasii TaxID=199306 RepID=E9CY63_COCPS|nr:conserved hypothetical protein [Coccidioides posadasii str. Silveira]KMM72554.1 hypothetical protein CPAG_08848 [Coccidioides posadasii RMSCC 3488]